jgi:hypothetical protein
MTPPTELDARMTAALDADPARFWWSAQVWAAFLRKPRCQVVQTATWTEVVRAYRLAAFENDPKSVDRRLMVSKSKKRPGKIAVVRNGSPTARSHRRPGSRPAGG